MMSFAAVLSDRDIADVIAFIRQQFVDRAAYNTRYHTPENGWPDHERYRDAFGFATGALRLDQADLTLAQQRGRSLFLSACVGCHERGAAVPEAVWEKRPLSYPRNGYQPAQPPDAISGASPYLKHETVPQSLRALTPQEQRGAELFAANCAFCHGHGATGQNWIGSFIEPHPRDLSDRAWQQSVSDAQLFDMIANGKTGTAMPAWKRVLTPADIDAVVRYLRAVFLRPEVSSMP
jgi:cytochrome c oxidase cbb3-type subunit 3